MLFLDNSRMKNFTAAYKGFSLIFPPLFIYLLFLDVKFLNFFYKQLRMNEFDRYKVSFSFQK